MKKHKNLFFILLLIVMICVIAGCKKQSKTSLDNETETTDNKAEVEEKNDQDQNDGEAYVKKGKLAYNSLVLTVGDIEVGYDEVSVYLRELKEKYQSTFGSSIWTFDLGNNKSFADLAKEEAIKQVIQLKIIRLKAAEQGIELIDEEELEIMKDAEEDFATITDKYKEEYSITLELLKKTYADNYLASKVFEVTTNNVSTQVSEEESKQITIQQILVKTSSEDSDGNRIELTEKEKRAAFTKAKKLRKEVKEKEDFYSYAREKTNDIDVEYTIGKGDMVESVENAAFALKTGELSEIIESELGYHIIYCVSDYDEAATAESKESIIEERQNSAFEEIYAKWAEEYKVEINKEIWDQVNILTEQERKEVQSELDSSQENGLSEIATQ